MNRPNSYFDYRARRSDDVPLDVVEWKQPADDSYVVEHRELSDEEFARFKALIEGLK